MEIIRRCDEMYHRLCDELEKSLISRDKLRSNAIKVYMERLGDEKFALCTKLYDLIDQHMVVGSKQNIELGKILKTHGIAIGGLTRKRFSSTPNSKDLDIGAEPLYCLCGQVAYGDMVGCDNEDCPVEWFHYKCVGITKPPKNTWLCPVCTAARKK